MHTRSALAFIIALTACGHAATQDHSKRGLNLGPQQGLITLTSGSNNNLNIAPNGSTTTFLRFAVNSSGSTISGMDATTVSPGDMFVIRSDSASGGALLTLTHEDTNSTTTNRFRTPGGKPVSLALWGAALVEYDATVSRWVVSVVAPANPYFQANVSAPGSTSQIPVQTSCGTSPSIVAGSTAFAGTYTTGSGATTCTLTFATAFDVAPSCLIVGPGAAVVVPTYTTSTTAITVSVDIASTTYQYVCVGH